MFDTYLINLDRSTDRLEVMAKDLDREKIAYERISAVDGASLSPQQLESVDDTQTVSKLGRKLNNGEIGCFLSHIQVAERVLAGTTDVALVLEDDASIPENTRELIEQIAYCLHEKVKNKWTVVNLGNPAQKLYRDIGLLQENDTTYRLRHAFYFPILTTALLWSKSGAEQFLRTIEKISLPVDVHLQNFCCRSGQGLAVNPAPFQSRGVRSVISSQNPQQGKNSKSSTIRSLPRKWENYTSALKHLTRHNLRRE